MRPLTFSLFTLVALALVIPTGGAAQDIDTSLAAFGNTSPVEKAYVQFDKRTYLAGETIWYKIYLITGFEPSLLSRNFYLNWYDDRGQLIGSTVTPVISGYSAGQFAVPATGDDGCIHVVGYTRGMRNYDTAFFFRATFTILPTAKQIRRRRSEQDSTVVEFLPESGTLLAGRTNVIAFKAVNGEGLPEDITGVIQNSSGQSVTAFRSVWDGMGSFQLEPVADDTYTAEWKDARGRSHTTRLPPPEEYGVHVTIEPGEQDRVLHIQRTETVPSRLEHVMLVGEMYGRVLFTTPLDLSTKELVTTRLPAGQLNSGVLRLLLFDAIGHLVCERPVFVKNGDLQVPASIRAATLNTGKRGKNTLEIQLEDTAATNLSLSITGVQDAEPLGNNILTQMLLTGELVGSRDQLGDYFSSTADSPGRNLDLVMLTSGPGKYSRGSTSYGRDSATGPERPDLRLQQGQAADSLGKKGTLKEVIVHGKARSAIKQLDDTYTSGVFSGEAAASFDMGAIQNDSHTGSVFDFLTGKVQGLTIGNTQGGTASVGVVQYRGAEVTFYVDERPVLFTDLDLIAVPNIAYIKVFSPPFAGGFTGSGTGAGGAVAGGGAIAIYLKRGGVDPSRGYIPAKEFVSPDYGQGAEPAAGADLRTTLYWNPWIHLDNHHKKITVTFFNNDITHRFHLVLEGMDSRGRLVHVDKILP